MSLREWLRDLKKCWMHSALAKWRKFMQHVMTNWTNEWAVSCSRLKQAKQKGFVRIRLSTAEFFFCSFYTQHNSHIAYFRPTQKLNVRVQIICVSRMYEMQRIKIFKLIFVVHFSTSNMHWKFIQHELS